MKTDPVKKKRFNKEKKKRSRDLVQSLAENLVDIWQKDSVLDKPSGELNNQILNQPS